MSPPCQEHLGIWVAVHRLLHARLVHNNCDNSAGSKACSRSTLRIQPTHASCLDALFAA